MANIKGDWRKATKNPKDVRVRIGYTSPEEREKIKEALELINSFGPLEAPRVIECEAVEKIKKILEE